MGLFWEVPIMLGLVFLGKALRKSSFWNGKDSRRMQQVRVGDR